MQKELKEFTPLERLRRNSNAFVEQEIRKWIYEIDVFYNVSFRYTQVSAGYAFGVLLYKHT